jgi:glucose/arabinose dehydrogenase
VQGHQNRHLAIDPKTGALFVGVGSAGNLGVEPQPKASIQRFNADGSNQTTFATGLRNPTALAFQPETGDLYAVVQERDGLGDRLPSDYLTRVQENGFYGWPYAYIGKHPQPGFANRALDKVNATITPDLLFEAHSSALDLVTSIAPSTQIVRFDPTSQTFQSWAIPGGGEIVRNMAVTGDGNVARANSLINEAGRVEIK